MKYADKIPYAFVLDHLTRVEFEVKPMFGCYAIYAGEKLCLFMVQRDKPIIPGGRTEQNGIYVATTKQHIEALKKDFQAAEFDMLKGDKAWMFFSEGSRDFERYAVRACELISAIDMRIGR